jgi:TPR repeat protein
MRALALGLLLVAPARADGTVDDAAKAVAAGDGPRALAILRPLAEAGDAAAMLALADLHADGKLVPKSDPFAQAWYGKAVEAGALDAALDAARRSMRAAGRVSGCQLAASIVVAVHAADPARIDGIVAELQEAAAGGDPAALTVLAVASADPHEELLLLWLAAEKGVAEARSLLGRAFVAGIGTLPDREGGLAWLRRSAEQGDAYGQFLLGECLVEGADPSAPPDPEGARWLERAAAQGYGPARTKLGLCHALGIGGVGQDDAKALALYELAAGQGETEALLRQGFFIAFGRGTEKDEERGFALAARAAAVDPAALAAFESFADTGTAVAQFHLALVHEQAGRIDAAREWMARAAAQGSEAARRWLEGRGD